MLFPKCKQMLRMDAAVRETFGIGDYRSAGFLRYAAAFLATMISSFAAMT